MSFQAEFETPQVKEDLHLTLCFSLRFICFVRGLDGHCLTCYKDSSGRFAHIAGAEDLKALTAPEASSCNQHSAASISRLHLAHKD